MADLKAAHGLLTDDDWLTALKIRQSQRDYIRDCRARGESLLKTPRITVSTIHGVKGGEADSVLLLTDMAKKSFEHYALFRKGGSEHRVFYTGASRARETLILLEPQPNKFCYSYDGFGVYTGVKR
jgi:superfamily I DNA/RNA helicase